LLAVAHGCGVCSARDFAYAAQVKYYALDADDINYVYQSNSWRAAGAPKFPQQISARHCHNTVSKLLFYYPCNALDALHM
jgi:hypothetical protein